MHRSTSLLLFSWNDTDISLIYYLLDEKQNNIYLVWFCNTIIIDSEKLNTTLSFCYVNPNVQPKCVPVKFENRKKNWKSPDRITPVWANRYIILNFTPDRHFKLSFHLIVHLSRTTRASRHFSILFNTERNSSKQWMFV